MTIWLLTCERFPFMMVGEWCDTPKGLMIEADDSLRWGVPVLDNDVLKVWRMRHASGAPLRGHGPMS